MFGLSDLYTKLILGIALFVVAFGAGAYLTHKLDDGKYQRLVAADAAANAAAIGVALKEQSDVDAKRLSAAVSEANAQVRIVTQHDVITKEIPRYVTDTAHCITFGLVRLLHAAATGADPAGDTYTAGQSDGACAPVSWTSLAADYSDDLATGRSNAEQLDALIAYERSIEAAQPVMSK